MTHVCTRSTRLDTRDSGQSGSTAANASVPASAFQSVDSFIAFVRGLGSDETSEPLTLPAGAAPTSDTTEPAA